MPRKLMQKEFESRLHKINPNIKILGKYKKANSYIDVACKKCGCHWSTKAESLLQSHDCPKCANKESKGEQSLEKYFKKHHYKYEWQYTISNCHYKLPLPFDFAIFNSNGSLNCLIEYQGWQHYLRSNDGKYHGFFSDKQLQDIHKRDIIKQEYCKNHNIKLIYINHPQTNYKSNKTSFIKNLVKTTLDNQLHVN